MENVRAYDRNNEQKLESEERASQLLQAVQGKVDEVVEGSKLVSQLIHEADPQLRPVVITFQNLTKQNNFKVRIVMAHMSNLVLY